MAPHRILLSHDVEAQRAHRPAPRGTGLTFLGEWIDGRPYDVDIDLDVVEGRLSCVGIHVRSTGEHAVTASLLRKVNIAGDFLEPAYAWLGRTGFGEMKAGYLEYGEDQPIPEAVAWRSAVRKAKQAKGIERLEAVAVIYSFAARRGLNPTQEVAKKTGYTYSAAVGLVRQCRKKGLLPTTTRGRVRS